MKKFVKYFSILLASASFAACQTTELENVEETVIGAQEFEVFANIPETKTVNDGMSTKWAEGDTISIFHAEAGKDDYVNDGKFTVADPQTGRFTGTICETLSAQSYDWYSIYPYTLQKTTPAGGNKGYIYFGCNSKSHQTQDGNDSMAHLCGVNVPMYGVVKGVAKNVSPALVQHQLASVVQVHVTNNTSSDLSVTNAKFTATEDVIGTYYVDITGDKVTYTKSGDSYVSNTAELSVENATALANGASADFYIVIKPFSASTGELKVSVNGYEKTISLTKEVSFAAGKIKTINFNYNKEPEADYVTLPWEWEGGSSAAFSDVSGVTASGLGSDYAASNAPYLIKLDTTGDYFIIKTDSSIGVFSIGVKMIGGATTSYIKIQGSVDGTNYSDVQTLTISGKQNDVLNLSTTSGFDPSYRYVKAVFTKGANVGVGPISISKPDTTPSLTLLKDSISGIAAAGVSNSTESGVYSLRYASDSDVDVTCDGTVVTSASISGGVLTYSVSENTGTAREGWVKLTLSDQPYQITIQQQSIDSDDEDVYTLVTDASTLAVGDQLVIACFDKGVVAGDISSSVMSSEAASFSDDGSTVSIPSECVVLTLGGESGAWTLSYSSKLLGSTAAKKVAWNSGTTTWSILIDGNNNKATIQSTTETYGRFLYNVGSPRFTTYTSDATVSMVLPELYRVSGGVTPPVEKTLESISVSGQKTSFNVGDTFSFGGTVIAQYSDNTTADVTASASFSGYEMSTDGEQTVTVSYTEGGVTETTTYVITVSPTGSGQKTYTKVTAAPSDWSGTYIISYVDGTSAFVYNGTDSDANNGVSATITNNSITGSDFVEIEIAAMTGGYSLKVVGGTNNGKYLSGGTSNGTTFNANAVANSISLNTDGTVKINNNTTTSFQFNSASNQQRFRYFKSAQKGVTLFKK